MKHAAMKIMPGIGKMNHFDPFRISTELIYTLIIVALCILIYYKTREMYSLTKHKGIGFFRLAFLFLGFSFIMRLVPISMRIVDFETAHSLMHIMPITLAFTGYISTIAFLYLFMSTIWKKIDHLNTNYVLIYMHVLALAITILTLITRSPWIMLYTHIVLLLLAVIMSFVNNVKKRKIRKKFSHTFAIYSLMVLFWIINLFPLIRPRFLPMEFKIGIQIIPIIIFALIYYKVSKWTK